MNATLTPLTQDALQQRLDAFLKVINRKLYELKWEWQDRRAIHGAAADVTEYLQRAQTVCNALTPGAQVLTLNKSFTMTLLLPDTPAWVIELRINNYTIDASARRAE